MSQTERSIFEVKLAEANAELSQLREQLRSVTIRLGEAEDVVRYYGNPRVYGISKTTDNVLTYQDRVKPADHEKVSDNTWVAGQRARRHLKKYEEDVPHPGL